MEPLDLTFPIQQGAPAQLWLRMKQNGASVPLVGYTANWEIWDSKRHTKYAEVSVDFPNRTDGQIRGRLTGVQTKTIPTRAGRAVHDLHLFPPVGDDFYLVKGAAVADPRVSLDAP